MAVYKSYGHICFFIDRCRLFESVYIDNNYYELLIHEILWPDTDKLSDEEMVTISKILNGEEL